MRLDQYLISLEPLLSRKAAVVNIESGNVKVNGEPSTKASYKLKDGDSVSYSLLNKEVLNETISIDVVYEDDDCIVIYKPEGVLSHSKGGYNPEATVESWLKDKTNIKGDRAGIVHRLDRATSGVMICAKTPEAQKFLQKQFATRNVKKTYNAVVVGLPSPEEAILDLPIARNPKDPKKFRVDSNGKTSTTKYKVLQPGMHYSLVELKPTTGRTHQLRVHLNYINHPILGDKLYSKTNSDRLYLHALELEITIPSRQRKTFTVGLPKNFYEKIS